MANNPWLYPDSPLSADAKAKLRARLDEGDAQARKAAADNAAALRKQDQQRAALRGGKA